MSTRVKNHKHAFLFVVLSAIIIVFSLTGCNQQPEVEQIQYGSISGKVLYSNGTDHSGILLTLDRTDGLRAITREDGSRSVEGVCYSQADGSFGFYNLTPGTYTV